VEYNALNDPHKVEPGMTERAATVYFQCFDAKGHLLWNERANDVLLMAVRACQPPHLSYSVCKSMSHEERQWLEKSISCFLWIQTYGLTSIGPDPTQGSLF
jgi:hypothetical protein